MKIKDESPRYKINQGVNSTFEFFGFRGKYLMYMGGALMGAFFLFIILHALTVPDIVSGSISVGIAGFAYFRYSKLSLAEGVFGIAKKEASEKIKSVYCIRSRKLFLDLRKKN